MRLYVFLNPNIITGYMRTLTAEYEITRPQHLCLYSTNIISTKPFLALPLNLCSTFNPFWPGF